MTWISITNNSQLEELITSKDNQLKAIFKHSTRCGISRMVLKSFESEFDLDENQITMYFLDLLNFREISNKIAKDMNVYHQSPQLIAFKNGEVLYHASHSDISVESLKKLV